MVGANAHIGNKRVIPITIVDGKMCISPLCNNIKSVGGGLDEKGTITARRLNNHGNPAP